jgi:DNA-directed RNA polymerase subunit alpha
MQQINFTVTDLVNDKFNGKFVIEPLARGYGDTLGNALRRVLYNSIPGAAITSVSISGVSHQFSTIAGVSEDVVQIILNLKQVRFTYTGTTPVKINLSAKGLTEVTAGKFELPSGVSIANPELVVATLSDKSAKLEIEATVEAGFGYSPADERETSTLGVIPVDATFSPVLRVNYAVDSTRVGRITDFDKLTLEITTDGSVSPKAALTTAASHLANMFSLVANPEAIETTSTKSTGSKATSSTSSVSVEELDLPTRIANALQKAGFNTVGDILSTTKAELAKVKNLGAKSATIIDSALRERGIEMS